MPRPSSSRRPGVSPAPSAAGADAADGALRDADERAGRPAAGPARPRPAKARPPAKRKRSAGRRRDERLQDILDAALDVFSEAGFTQARLEDVAARAGVAKGTLYLYVSSKQDLFERLVRTGIGGPIEAMAAPLLALDAPIEQKLRPPSPSCAPRCWHAAQGHHPPLHHRGRALPRDRRILPSRGAGPRPRASARPRRGRRGPGRVPVGRARALSAARRGAGSRRARLGAPVRTLRAPRQRRHVRRPCRSVDAGDARRGAMKRILIRLVVLAAIVGLAVAGWFALRPRPAAPGYQGYVEGYLVFMGAEDGGRIVSAKAEPGDQVEPGQFLFALDPSVQEAQKREAEARLHQMQAQLANLQSALQRPEQIAVLKAQEERAKAQLDYSRSDLDRQKTLFLARLHGAGAARSGANRPSSATRPPSPRCGSRSRRARSPAARARSAPPKPRCAWPRPPSRRPRRGLRSAGQRRSRPASCRTSISAPARSSSRASRSCPCCRRATAASASTCPSPMLATLALGAPVAVTCDSCPADLGAQGQLHRPGGGVHAAGDLQSRGAPQARLPRRGAAFRRRGAAARPAGHGLADGSAAVSDDLRHRHRRRGADEVLRQPRRRARPDDAGQARADLRLPRAERQRQDDDHPHALRPPDARQRTRHLPRLRHPHAAPPRSSSMSAT